MSLQLSNHEALIDLKTDIKMLKIDDDMPKIPRYHFNFTDFSSVVSRFDEISVLIGSTTAKTKKSLLPFARKQVYWAQSTTLFAYFAFCWICKHRLPVYLVEIIARLGFCYVNINLKKCSVILMVP